MKWYEFLGYDNPRRAIFEIAFWIAWGCLLLYVAWLVRNPQPICEKYWEENLNRIVGGAG